MSVPIGDEDYHEYYGDGDNNNFVDSDHYYRHVRRNTMHSSSYSYYPHESNSTLKTSITIHVTPQHYHLISWAILWGCFVAVIIFAAIQVHYENAWFEEVAAKDHGDGAGTETTKKSRKQSKNNHTTEIFATRDGRPIRMIGSATGGGSGTRRSRYDVEHGSLSANSSGSDAEVSISTADWTRRKFRILLLVAIICRTIMIPVQIYFEPIWIQLLADTLPVMTFASAWTLLVSFFVKLVGVALGATGSGEIPDSHHNHHHRGSSRNYNGGGSDGGSVGGGANIALPVRSVIQLTAYVLYFLLMGTFFMNHVAAVLLYAFLSCIYATLLGTSLYFCPRLLTLLYPTLSSMMNTSTSSNVNINNGQSSSSYNNLRSAGSSSAGGDENNKDGGSNRKWNKYSALAIRLASCGIICVIVFGARTVGFCRQIVTPDHPESWWWQYGCLELFPALIFLILIKPKSSGSNNPSGMNAGNNSSGSGQDTSKSPPPLSSFTTSSQKQQQQQRHNPQQLLRSNSYGSGEFGGGGGRRSENTPLLKSTGGYGSSGGGGGISSGPPSPSAHRK